MGRPLPKRFFGNRNLGSSSTTADEGLGGSRIASVTVTGAGNYAAGDARPTVSFSVPDLAGAGAVTAAGTVTYRARTLTAAPSGTQTKAYQVGQVLTLGSNGTTATAATLAATGTLTTVTITGTAGQIAFDDTGTAMLQGTSVTISGTYGGTGSITGYTDPTTYFVQTATTTTATLVSTYAAAVAGTGGAIVTTAGTPTGLTYTTGSTAGALATVSTTPTAKGSYTDATMPAAAQATTTTGGGAGATIAVATYEVASVTMTENGSGYSTASDGAPTFSAGTAVATGTSVLEADGTGIYEFGTNENAITISAYLPTTAATGLISGAGGAAAKNGDIQKQVHRSRYVVENADGVGRVRLVAAAPAAGEANIIAEDSTGGTYYVIKLTRHRATVVPDTGTQFVANQSVPWTFDAATLDTTVKVRNT
jgi:hypothetical protein